jgi:alkylation response protein AidB-like acyl-CoA dehydrogenase
MDTTSARNALAAWKDSFPADPFTSDRHLRAILGRSLKPDRLAALEDRASAFARLMTTVVGPAAARYEQRQHLPELARYDAIGTRTENVQFDPAYHEAAVAVWASGLVALSGTPGRAFEQATLLYLLSLEGEAGQACPATCTIGLARALRRAGDPGVRERFLPALVDPVHGHADRGSQFLTEVQGGSDVGANVCRAEPAPDGATYRITGEKWFCSVADADQFFLTARVAGGPDGTRGLGSFVVPRMIDGAPNGFTLRRLKDKLGTRGLASGEIDFDGAVAWPIGPVEHGFRTAVGIVLNTSRWMTAVGDAGMMRRAVLDAVSYARHREAFGRPVEQFPPVRRTLADMTATSAGALHLAFALTGLEDVIDDGTADDADVLYHRFLVNVSKYVLSVQATDVVHSAIEILGGNGTIEEFSVLPRLYRDAIVYESWEGTHNVLVNQVLNDLRRLPILDEVARRLGEVLERAAASGLSDAARPLLDATIDDARRSQEDPDFGAWHFRRVLDRLGVLAEVVYLIEGGEEACAAHLLAGLTSGGPGSEEPPSGGPGSGLVERVEAVLAAND